MTQTVEHQEIKALAEELFTIISTRWIELDQDTDVWAQSDVGICTDRVRQIGEQLNRIGGLALMMDARMKVAFFCLNFSTDFENVFNTEINWVWNGIGGWLA